MNLDSLVTVAGLIAAVYAVLPRTRRLEISLRFGVLGWIIIGIGFFTVIYLQFYQTFRTFWLTPGLNLVRWGITPANASFLVMFCTSLALFAYLSLQGLSRLNVIKFRELVLELSREKRYSELFYLIQKFIDQIKKIYSADFPLARLKRYFERNSNERSLILAYSELSDEEKEKKFRQLTGRFRSWVVRPIYRRISSILPGYKKEREVTEEIIYELLLNEKTVQAIANTRPYFALLILEKNFYENQEFIEIYLRSLACDTKSILYLEIKNNQSFKSHDEYDLPERNRLLRYLFADSRIAKKYAVYRPIGEFVISELDRLYISDLPDPYNEPMGDFLELGQWESKILGGIKILLARQSDGIVTMASG